MSFTQSELNLSSNANEKGMKTSNSAFEILSRSNSNLAEAELEPQVDAIQEAKEEVVKKKSGRKSGRPKTFK